MHAVRLLFTALVLSCVACSERATEDGTPAAAGGAGGVAGTGGTSGAASTGGGAPDAGPPISDAGPPPSDGAAPPPEAGAGAGSVDDGSHVISWVPPYRVQDSKVALDENFGGVGMKDGLSYLGLQFWITDGPATRLDTVTVEDIEWFQDWGQRNGVKVLLCLHNYVDGWNWPEAVRSYRDNRQAFAAHLLAEVERFELDGIDLDMEGIVDPTEDETQAYYAFAQDLADGLHPKNKVLTVASFHGPWNAPSWNWWPTLLPIVDGIASMGYEQSGLNVDYAELVSHASADPKKLMIGVPSHVGEWQGNTAVEQLDWLVAQGQVGVAIWDAALRDPAWRQADVWQRLNTIRDR